MADGPTLALQKALLAALKADAAVAEFVGGRIYDEPPQAVTFPYVRIGNIDLAPLRMSGTCVDDDITFSIEVHSRPDTSAAGVAIRNPGRVEATRIVDAIRQALDDQALPIAGFNTDWVQYLTQAVTRSADGKSYTATIAFEAALSAL